MCTKGPAWGLSRQAGSRKQFKAGLQSHSQPKGVSKDNLSGRAAVFLCCALCECLACCLCARRPASLTC